MNRNEALAYLTRCADHNGVHWYQGRAWSDVESCPTCHGTNDAGWLACPCSRYGRTSADVAPIAYRHSRITGTDLDDSMSLAVNDSDEIEADLRKHAARLAGADIDDMVEGYLETQLWAQHDDRDPDGGITLDANYDRDDVADEYVEKIRDEFAALVLEHTLAVRMYLRDRSSGSFGHDFYLTREGHGAGFWDRGLRRDLGTFLTDIAKWAGSADDLSDNGDGVLV